MLESETFVTELYLSHLEKRVVKSCFSVETTRDPIGVFCIADGHQPYSMSISQHLPRGAK